MAVTTIYELFDIIEASGGLDLSITATDINNQLQTVISSENAEKYLMKKYPTRQYSVLKGQSVTPAEAKADFNEWFHIWLLTRQHNIDRMFQALNNYNYSPIENVDRYENETTLRDLTDTYGKRVTHSGSDATAHTGTVADAHTGTITDAHTGTIDVTNTGTTTTEDGGQDRTTDSGSVVNETEKAGFNSPNSYTNAEKNTETYNNRQNTTVYGKEETVTNNLTEETTHHDTDTRTHGNTDTTTFNNTDTTTHGEVISDSGADTHDDDTTRTLHVHGNIGVTTNNQLIEAELEMRLMSLAEMLLDNFIDDTTFYS